MKKKVTVRVKGRKQTVTRKVRQTLPAALAMPTVFTAQNGMVIKQNTPIGVTGCPKAKKPKARQRQEEVRPGLPGRPHPSRRPGGAPADRGV